MAERDQTGSLSGNNLNEAERFNQGENLNEDNQRLARSAGTLGAELVLKIEGLSHQGEGVGRAEGQVVFVAGALPGETVRARVVSVQSRLLRGALLEVLEASPQRIEPACEYLAQCGGCNLQHAEYAQQLRLKQQIVKQALQRIGRLPADLPVKPTLGMVDPWRYRNKAELHVEADPKRGEVRLGYYEPGSHKVIDIADCLLLSAELREILAAVKAGLRELLSYLLQQPDAQTGAEFAGGGELPSITFSESTFAFPLKHILFRQSFLTGEIALIWVVTAPDDLNWRKWVSEFGTELLNKFPKIICLAENINPAPFKTLLGRDTRIILGRPRILEGIGELRFLLSPVSFYQINPVQTEVLYQHVLDFAQLTGTEKVLDVYCGVGTIALFLARSAAQVIGIEVVAEAVADAKRNAQLNGIKNAYFYKGTAEEWFKPESPGKQSRGRGKKYEKPAAAEVGISKIQKMYVDQGKFDDRGKSDVVVLNPPRGGCDKIVLEGVSRLSPERIVYVSCNPATLARDLRFLVDKGYAIREIQPVDMFPQTYHVETVVLMSQEVLWHENNQGTIA